MDVKSDSRVGIACEDFRIILDRGYHRENALNFVADHHLLNNSERMFVSKFVHSQKDADDIRHKLKDGSYLSGRHLAVDGFNVLITVENHLNGGECILCQDGLLRDNLISFSNYKVRESTEKAAEKVLEYLLEVKPKTVRWIFDSQISGSGRLAKKIMDKLDAAGIPGESITSPQADSQLSHLNLLTATTDPNLIKQLTQIVDIPQNIINKKK